MRRQLRFRAEAFADVAEAFSWYQERRLGLDWEFDADLDATLALLRQVPEAGPVVSIVMFAVHYFTDFPMPSTTHSHRTCWRSAPSCTCIGTQPAGETGREVSD